MARKQEAVAVLFSIDPDKEGDVSYALDIFRESEGVDDPIAHAMGLLKACRGDFPPTRLWAVTGNDRAYELRSQRMLKALGMENE